MINYRFEGNDLYIEFNEHVNKLFPNLLDAASTPNSNMYIEDNHCVISRYLNETDPRIIKILTSIIDKIDKYNRNLQFDNKFKELVND